MNKYTEENLKLYFPHVYEMMVDHKELNDSEVEIKLDDGRMLYYNDLNRRMRSLPNNNRELTEDECRSEFGLRLKNVLWKKNITQTELANISGIPRETISRYISGKITPSFFTVDKLAKALDCSMDELRYY